MVDQKDERAAAQTSAFPPSTGVTIQNMSAWVLRVGVLASVAVMLVGIVFSFIHGPPTIERMTHDGFDYRPDDILRGIAEGRGKSIIELGIYLLVFTPIMRVTMSMILFAFGEKDRLYALITLLVLLMTLAGLLFLG